MTAAAAVDVDGKGRTGSVQSIGRAFALLEVMADLGGTAGLSQLAAASGLPLPTIHRLLHTLIALGYVRQEPSRQYVLGPKLIRLGESSANMLGVWARPHLTRLVDELGESANLAMLDGDQIVYVAQVQSRHSMRMFTEVGRRAHTHATGVGKAILAQLDDDTVRGIVTRAGMPTPTAKSIGDVEELLADLKLIRERGYSIDEEEQELGVRCFAMAVPNAPTPAAISVSGPVSRVDGNFADKAVPILREAAEAISRELNRT